MRILITGGCGFLGSHLVEHFLKNTDADLVVLDKLTYASSGFDRLRDIADSRADGEVGDIRRRVKVLGCDLAQPVPDGVVQEIGQVDYIVHAAAESHVDKSIVDPLPFLESNVIGTHHLLMMAMRMRELTNKRPGPPSDIRRIFLVSTDEVYGPAPFDAIPPLAPTMPWDDGPPPEAVMSPGFHEQSRFRPANPYAASKAGGEAVAMAYANTYKLPITIVNTMNLIGERQHPEKFVPLVIRKVLRGEKVIIHADPTRTRSGTRFYLHCRTYAHALGWLMDCVRDAWHRTPGDASDLLPLKVHVCGEREIANLDLAQMITGIMKKCGRETLDRREGDSTTLLAYDYELDYELVDFHSSRPGHDLRYAMDDTLIRRMGWVRPMNLEQSLDKTVRWYLANPKWLGL
jgi:dTDP-D-glucose 4,6-dehydratase